MKTPSTADNRKMHRSDARRPGITATLMNSIEDEALRAGRWLMVLDTVTDSSADLLLEVRVRSRHDRAGGHPVLP
jgi:hypothetical protein